MFILKTDFSGPIYDAVGYYGVFGIAAGFNVFALLYVVIFVKETVTIFLKLQLQYFYTIRGLFSQRHTKKYRGTIIRDLFDARQVFNWILFTLLSNVHNFSDVTG